jgi:hypothetical protein
LSNEPDADLAGEIAKGGGFDLLVRPFERAQVLQSLFFAYGQYKLSSTIGFLGRMENKPHREILAHEKKRALLNTRVGA